MSNMILSNNWLMGILDSSRSTWTGTRTGTRTSKSVLPVLVRLEMIDGNSHWSKLFPRVSPTLSRALPHPRTSRSAVRGIYNVFLITPKPSPPTMTFVSSILNLAGVLLLAHA
jgi:hypothetical protein